MLHAVIPELIQIAAKGEYSENTKKKHEKSGEVCRYNIFFARMLARYDADGRRFLYDLIVKFSGTSY